MEYVIGVDLGTGSLKSVLYDKSGVSIASASYSYPLIIEERGYSEQKPHDWIEGLHHTLESIFKEVPSSRYKTKGLAISGQMHSLVMLDSENKVIRNAILWNDVRTTKQCAYIEKEINIVDITKNKALEGFTLPKLLWVQENEPLNWSRLDTFLLPKDYLVYYLTGKKVMDYSDAAGTLMLDFNEKKWSLDIFEKFNLNPEWAPELKWSTEEVSNIQRPLLTELGFESDVTVFAGAADNAAAALASGIVDSETGLVSVGTSGVFLSYEESNTKDYNGQIHYFNHSIENRYYSMGVTLAAGKSLEWFKSIVSEDMNFEELLSNIESVPAGSDGLLFTPYIMGERTPYTNANIRGSFIGIDASHTKDHMIKSVLEGITYSLKESMVIMQDLGKDIKRIVSTGGGAQNCEWLQIQADIFGVPVTTLTSEEGPAQGAAMIASIGLSWFNNLEECVSTFVKYRDSVIPIENNVEIYNQYYDVYTKVYNNTKYLSEMLINIQKGY